MVIVKVFLKYLDFPNIFISVFAIKLLEYSNMNNYTIKLVKHKQTFYKLIYSPSLIKLEILKIFIKNFWKTMFI